MTNVSYITKLFLAFLLFKKMVQSYLDNRNRAHIFANKNTVPKEFEEKISLVDHQKAATYSLYKIKVAGFWNFIDLVLLLGWTLGGGLNQLDTFARSFDFAPEATGVLFFCLFGAISTIIGLPQSIHNTFFVEEKFGFNKTTPKTFIIDMIKGLALGSLIGLPILFGILKLMSNMGEFWWAYAFVFLTSIQFILMWAYPNFIAPMFNKFTELEEGDVKSKILSLLERTGFTSSGLFIMDASKRSSHGNAYFTGFGKTKRIVFFDTLIKTLEPSEVEAVLAHELGHFKKKHIVQGLIKSVFFSFIGFYVLGLLYKSPSFYIGHGAELPSPYMALMLFTMVSGVYTFFLTPINALSSRKYEFEADQFAVENSDGNDLIHALVKMYKDNASTLTPDPMYSAFYHSHPPALIRVDHLKKCMGVKDS